MGGGATPREELRVRIGVLGPLEVRDTGGTLVPVGGARLRSLLIRLAIGDGRPVSVDRLADDLWADGGPADAANAIQALVSRLRNAAGRDCVEHSPAGYRLAIDPAEVDARAFENLVVAARDVLADGDQAAGAAMLAQALGLWRGPALADVADAPFAAAPITRLSELRLAAIEDRVDADLSLGRGAGLVPELQELAAAHPLRERLRGQLMRALQAAGRQADALTAYEDTRRVLADQLGVDPSPGLAAVHLAILRGVPPPAAPAARSQFARPATPAPPAGPAAPGPAATRPDPGPPAGPAGPPPAANPAAPPARPPGGPLDAGAAAPPAFPPGAPRRGNLPAQLTSFVGRDDELRRLGKLLAESRLVTLTGPGGAGKTRLSIEASARMTELLPDGVWFVPLAPVRDALDVPQAVLAALGLQESAWPADPVETARLAAQQPLDRLADALAARKLVLVLDNCEHVVDAVAWLAGRVLAHAPEVRILATSREPLGITGEMLCPVPSLRLPPEGASAEEAAYSPAVRLFTDRAAAVRPGFVLDPGTTEPVVRICRALDGIPLAIELAAARLRALTCTQVADRLDDRFRLLSVGSRGALPRHQTLRAIVDWSWDLLDDAERTVLRRLSVFSGGATPDSAEQVCALGGEHRDIIDVIASLVDKSLVTATGEHEVRYRLLETVRAYAGERLAEAGEADLVRAAHAAFFLALAERAEPELRARDQLAWLNRLSAEHDNCSAALRHVIAAGDVRTALRLVGALAWFWITRGYDTEAATWAGEVRELAGDTPPPDLRDAYALCELAAMMSKAQQEFPSIERMREVVARVVALASDSSSPLLVLAGPLAAVLGGDPEGARRGLAALADHRDPWLRAAQQVFTGHLALNEGHIDEAAGGLAAGYARFLEIGDRWGMIICLSGLAEVAMAGGQPAEAVRLLTEARGYATEGVASNLGEMMSIPIGRALGRTGDVAGARAELERGVGMADRLGEQDDEAAGYVELSELARRDGDLPLARSLLDRAMKIADPLAGRPDMSFVTATAYSRAGCIAEQEGDLAAAAQWHARALAALSGYPASLLPTSSALATVVAGIAALATARGEHTRAAELLGLAHTLQGFSDDGSLERTRVLATIRETLDQPAIDAAYARGRLLGRNDALALTP
jgi:predicted ATPase/DNA-binding SARP family transcriptional activator